jgi:hypothetical protein
MSFLTTTSLWVAAVVLLIPTTIFAMCGPVIVRRYVPLEELRSNNEVAGFKFATVGMVYAVLLAFAILVVWERFNQADNEVANEASADGARRITWRRGPQSDNQIFEGGSRKGLGGNEPWDIEPRRHNSTERDL